MIDPRAIECFSKSAQQKKFQKKKHWESAKMQKELKYLNFCSSPGHLTRHRAIADLPIRFSINFFLANCWSSTNFTSVPNTTITIPNTIYPRFLSKISKILTENWRNLLYRLTLKLSKYSVSATIYTTLLSATFAFAMNDKINSNHFIMCFFALLMSNMQCALRYMPSETTTMIKEQNKRNHQTIKT